MKKLFLFVLGVSLLSVVSVHAQVPLDGTPSATNVPNAPYPRVSTDGRVTFRVKAPEAQKVLVEPFNGNVDRIGYNGLGKAPFEMTKDKDGFWTVTTPPAVPGFHYYGLIIDGVSVADPSSETFFGAFRKLSAVEVPEPGVDFYQPKDVPHGHVQSHWYHSKITEKWQQAFVYLPPGYDANSRQRYPVLYLRHGGGENETGWVVQGHVNFILDNLIAAGKAKPMIVVMGSGYADRPEAPAAPPAGSRPGTTAQQPIDAVIKMAAEELIPEIDAHYRTVKDRDHRAIAGLSMGAAQTLAISMANLDKYSAVGVFSRPPTANFDPKTAFGGAMADAAALNKKLHLFWFGAGTAETGIFNAIKETRAAFDQVGIKYSYVEYPGLAHEWQSWRKQLNDFAPNLFKW